MITVTSLTHPTMVRKLRMALQYALLGQGHKMNGHRNRVYIQNAQGRNIMRLDWIGNGNYIVYGEESRTITAIVKEALKRADESERVENAKAFIQSNPDLKARLAKLATLAGMGLALTACSNHGGVTSIATIIGSIFT